VIKISAIILNLIGIIVIIILCSIDKLSYNLIMSGLAYTVHHSDRVRHIKNKVYLEHLHDLNADDTIADDDQHTKSGVGFMVIIFGILIGMISVLIQLTVVTDIIANIILTYFIK
jgi:hypothetical protein